MKIVTPRLLAVLSVPALVACSSESASGGGQCGSDQDCKGDRVCVAGECVDATSSSTGGSGGVGATSTSGGGAPEGKWGCKDYGVGCACDFEPNADGTAGPCGIPGESFCCGPATPPKPD